MIAWTLLDTAPVPGEESRLHLWQRGDEFSIRLGRTELMNSRLFGSEQALAGLTCDRLAALPRPRILIGGLGLGFTLRAALGRLGPAATVVVAELVPAVVAWAAGPLASIHGADLNDPRVTIQTTEVGQLIGARRAAFDAILLDVDNGPEGLVNGNDRLYASAGLGAAYRALRPNGVLAVWSAGPDRDFTRRLAAAGFAVETHMVRASGRGRGARHTIWLATRTEHRKRPA